MPDENLSVTGYAHDGCRLITKTLDRGSLPSRMVIQAIPGSGRIQVPLSINGTIEKRVEFAVETCEKLVVCVDQDSEGDLYISSQGRSPLSTLEGSVPDPAPPISYSKDTPGIEILFIFDGTARINLLQSFFGENDFLPEYTMRLKTLLKKLSGAYETTRVSVIAFGDQPMPGDDVKADELHPGYQIHPQRKEDRRFRPLDLDVVAQTVQGIPATSGGDFVDALADALFAASSLHWRPNTRRLLVLTGDSPGHSTEFPVHPGGDICIRERDVDVEAMRLHRQGVEIMTVYCDPSPSEIGLEQLKGRGLLEDARRQYRRLASLPEMAFVTSAFDPEKAAEVVLDPPPLIGRGSSYGILLEDSDSEDPGP